VDKEVMVTVGQWQNLT